MMTNTYMGAPVMRVEDDRLLRGDGRYLDDISYPGLLHAAFVRSEHAHAIVRGIDTTAAAALSGVHAVLTHADLPEQYRNRRLPQSAPIPAITAEITTPFPLAREEVCFVGEPIVLVLAESRHLAEDAAALVVVDYEPCPAAVDVRVASFEDSPAVRGGVADNRAGRFKAGWGDVAAAFEAAERIVKIEIETHRGGGHSMEGRGAIGLYEPHTERLTLWTSTQLPHTVRRLLSVFLGLEENRVRVATPDVGGGFGPKGVFYPEEVAVAVAAMMTQQPVKWVEDRREHFLACVQQRDQVWTMEAAVRLDGSILGVRGKGINDCGAYLLYGLLLPLNTVLQFPGPYAWPALDIELDCIFTNLTPTSPVRGAGRPYANFVIERLMDAIARELDIDPAALRRRNMIRSDQFPYETGMKTPLGAPIVYDSGSNEVCLDRALSMVDVVAFRQRQVMARKAGRYLGLGIASYVEDGGIPPFEGATIRVLPTGKVLVLTGAASQGQGHATIFAQICADLLGITPDQVITRAGDSDDLPRGIGTLGSRIAALAGSSVFQAATAVRSKILNFAAAAFGVATEDLELAGGHVFLRADETRRFGLAQLAQTLNGIPGVPLRQGFEPGLEATSYFTAAASVYSNGTMIAEVEVDVGTGAVSVKHCVFVHDCGRVLNPLLVEGQVIGGVVHGIGNALFERMVFGPDGQPLSTNYGEYLLMTATETPSFRIEHIESPSPRNPIGAKGVGESGTIPAASAVIAAVEDALTPFGCVFNRHPLSPEDILMRMPRFAKPHEESGDAAIQYLQDRRNLRNEPAI